MNLLLPWFSRIKYVERLVLYHKMRIPLPCSVPKKSRGKKRCSLNFSPQSWMTGNYHVNRYIYLGAIWYFSLFHKHFNILPYTYNRKLLIVKLNHNTYATTLFKKFMKASIVLFDCANSLTVICGPFLVTAAIWAPFPSIPSSGYTSTDVLPTLQRVQ